MSLEDFSRLRKEIDEALKKANDFGLTTNDQQQIFGKLRELRAIAIALDDSQHGIPARPVLPTKPVFPVAPPPVPNPPETPRLLAERIRFSAVEAQLQVQIESLTKSGQKSKHLRKQLRALKKVHEQQLEAIRVEDCPPPLLVRRQIMLEAHRAHKCAVNELERSWQMTRANLNANYSRFLRAWMETHRTSSDAIRMHSIERIEKQLKELMAMPQSSLPLEKVWWRFLPPPEAGTADIGPALAALSMHAQTSQFDASRLTYAYELKPSKIAIGSGEFTRYIAFIFESTESVLLECPMGGNAAYIFKEEWRVLSQCSKTELLNYHTGKVERVVHDVFGSWRWNIKRLLGR